MDIQKQLQLGDQQRKSRNFAEAGRLYQAILDQHPAHGRALLGLADACRGMGDYPRALALWAAYLEAAAPTATVLSRMADAYRKTGRTEPAIRLYQETLALDPRNRRALMALGDMSMKGKRPEEALGYWDRLLELDPRLINILTMVGNLHRQRRDFGQAEARFRQALALEPANPYAVFGLADALRGQGRFQDAAPFWETILQADPDNVQVLARAGDCFLHLGQLDKAERLFKAGLRLGFHKPASLGLARIYRERGQLREAIRQYRVVLARNPEDQRVWTLLREAEASLA